MPDEAKKVTPTATDAGKTLSSLGASKGGKKRAAVLTPRRRTEIARKAARARWDRYRAS
jgi:hypothetical protein